MTDIGRSAPLEAQLPPAPFTPDEGEICRVCRAEGDEDMPLIYPCKCAGSVRYVHADCLKQWLASRGGQRVCEICHHSYAFTKVYSDYLPRTIPFEVVIRQVVRILFQILYRISRVYLACNAWLLILPAANMYTLISMLWAVDIASPGPRIAPVSPAANETLAGNSTMSNVSSSNETRIAIHEIFGHPLRTMSTIVQDSWVRWNAGEANTIFGFIFRGQVLSIALTSLVMSIILIREWMSQHDWEAHAARERDRETIRPEEWAIRDGVARRKAARLLKRPEPSSTTTTNGVPSTGAVSDDVGDEADWEDEDTLETEPASDALRQTKEPTIVPGPSTPPARPCNADKEGFEKEVSYAAPELIGDTSMQDKGKGAAREATPPVDDQPNVAGPSSVDRDESKVGLEESATGNLAAPPMPPNSRHTSTSSQPNNSDGHTDGEDAATPAPPPEAPVVVLAAPDPPVPPLQPVNEQRPAIRVADGAAPAAVRLDDDEDFDDAQLDMEDWDGILEIVGLIGPVQNLVQNALFGYMIMGGSLFVLIGGPMWIGRLFLSIDYVQASIQFTQLVIKGTGLVFDPVVRVLHDICKEVIVLPLLSSVGAFEKIVAKSAGLGHTSHAHVERVVQLLPDSARAKAGDVFETIGSQAREQAVSLYHAHRTWSNQVLTSKTLTSRLTSVAVGYGAIAACMGLLVLNPSGAQGTAAAAIVESVRRNSQFIKLAFFMFIELAVFPIMIGFVIAFSLTPMLADWTWSTITSYAYEVPFGAIFIAWIIGTSFMFWFAAVLQKIRKLFRKGVLFFIRDPSERSYNPVQEILERPASSQIRKLSISAIMYTVVIAHLLGGWCWSLGRGPLRNLGILPLRMQQYDAITSVPFDQLFLFVMCTPEVTKRFPWSTCRRRAERWWRDLIHLYNLGSLLRYEKVVPPESTAATRIWKCLDVLDQIVLGRYYNTTCRARVPAADGIALLRPEERRGRGVFIRLDEHGVPTNEADKMRLLQQDAAAREKKRDPKNDYTVVWLPQYWRTRVHMLILTAMVVMGSLACFLVVGPLLAGRLMLDRLLSAPAHDAYNWSVGAGLIWWTSMFGFRVKRSVIASQRAERIRASTAATRVKRVAIANLRLATSAFILFLLLPILVGVAWELYAGMPLRYQSNSATPVLHLWEAWALGMAFTLTYVAMHHDADVRVRFRGRRRADPAWHFRQMYRELRLSQLDAVWSRTWRPMIVLLGMLVAPSLLALVMSQYHTKTPEPLDLSVFYRWLHPFCLGIAFLFVRRHRIRHRYQAFRQNLIDAEYVVEERIENFEASAEAGDADRELVTEVPTPAEQAEVVAVDVDDDDEGVENDDDDGGEASEWEDVDGP